MFSIYKALRELSDNIPKATTRGTKKQQQQNQREQKCEMSDVIFPFGDADTAAMYGMSR